MKKNSFILLILLTVSGCWGVARGQQDSWNRLDSLIGKGAFATARPEAERAWRQAESRERLLAAFYLTAIDYAYEKYAADSAIMRYSLLSRSLRGADRAVAYAFLFQSYATVYSHSYYKISRNHVSDDPKLHYLLWHRQRYEDTLMACVDSIVACGDLLRGADIEPYRRMFRRDSLTPPTLDSTLLGLLVQSLLNVDNWSVRQLVMRRVAALYIDGTPDERLWVDMKRLELLPSDSLEENAYDGLERRYRSQAVSGDIRALLNYKRAETLSDGDRKVEAEQLCLETERLYPGTYGAQNCRQLRYYINRQSFVVRYSHTESSQTNRLAVVEATNVSMLHLRLVKKTENGRRSTENLRDTLLQMPAVAEWDQPLPDAGDHLKHRHLVAIPAVAQGDYYLVAYSDSAFCFEELQSADAAFIAYYEPAAAGKKTHLMPSSGHLVDRVSGMPLVGRKVTLHGEGILTERDRRLRRRTDKEGFFQFPVSSSRYWFTDYSELSANVDGYDLFYGSQRRREVYSGSGDFDEQRYYLDLVMTDRPIYRLGDTVRFCCVAYERRASGSEWRQRVRPARNLRLTATFRLGSEKGDTLLLTTDRQGRCWGSFVVPADGMNGSYRLMVWSDNGKYFSYRSIPVEAYKPPKFTVTLSPMAEGVDTVAVRRMGQPVTFYGMAASYSGAPMSGAQVRWEVSRERLSSPLQWNSWADEYPWHDSLTVADDGTFQFTIIPTPCEGDTDRYAIYVFTAYARVIDADGELHEGDLSVRISGADGYCMVTFLRPENSSSPTPKASLSFIYNNLDHQPLEGEVRVTVQQLRQPDTLRFLERRLMAEYRDAQWVGSEADFRRMFPRMAFTPDEVDPRRWEVMATCLDTIMRERTLALGDLPSGMYRIFFETPDGMRCDTVVNYVAPGGRVTGTDMVWLRATPRPGWDYYPTLSCRVGDTVRIDMGSPYGRTPLYYRVSHGGKTFSKGMIMLDSSAATSLVIPVTKAMRDGFSVSLSAMRYGRTFQTTYYVKVRRPDKLCNIVAESFRDRLQPGARERWRLRVTDADSAGVEANLCLTMYDMALEQYRQFRYGFMPWRDVGDIQAVLDHGETEYEESSPTTSTSPVFVVSSKPQLGFGLWQLDGWYKQVAMRYGAGSLVGTVTDAKTGEVLPFVNVVLKLGDRPSQSATTDFDGHYIIRALPSGVYLLEVSYVGYGRFTGEVAIKGTGVTVCDIKLSSTATKLDCVEIVSEKAPVIEIGSPESGQRLSSDDIQRMPGNSVEEIVATMGGMGYDDGSMVTMQGGVRKRTGVNVPKDAIAEIPAAFDFDGSTVPVSVRQNLSTLAFFEPALRSGKDGSVEVEFTMPDALTQWRLTGFAWTDDYALGYLDHTLQTQKELMVQPLMPRFLRQGDTVELRAKVANLSDSALTVRVEFEVGGDSSSSILRVGAHASGVATFRFPVPEGERVMPYKVVARGAHHSDGEGGRLPVLSNKERVTTSRLLYVAGSRDGNEVRRTYGIPLPARQAGDSIAIAFTARPLDYAFEALPHFKRHRMPGNIYLANSAFVDHVASLDPTATGKERERAVSRCKNQLYDLLRAQHRDGGWSWMPRGREASLYVTEAVLQRLATCPLQENNLRYYTKAIEYLDQQLVESYHRDSMLSVDHSSLSTLYTRSQWMNIKPLNQCDSLTQRVYAYYLRRCRMHGRDLDWTLRDQGQLALLLKRMGDSAEAVEVATRIRERAHVADTLGMYWVGMSRVEDAALMVDVMADVLHDWEAVSRIQQWILSCRQGTTWRTDMATATAIAALMRAEKGKSEEVRSGETTLTVNGVPMTDTVFSSTSIPQFSLNIELRSTSRFPAWGAVFFSHDTPLDSIRTEGTGITLRRTLSTVATDGSLTVIKPGVALRMGERVRVHIDIYVERDLDRMVLRDQRAAGFEPVSTVSGWQWNDGLRYYVDMRDESSDCYIDHLAEGHYYVEYDMWVRHAGTFASGICTLQSVYAPEFRAHTGSEAVTARF
jgi:hypothetical protein